MEWIVWERLFVFKIVLINMKMVPKALKNISFSIQKGEKVVFLGGNGSGKSTLFLCMNGILRPKKGKILLDGKPIDYNRKGLLQHRSRVGIVFQEPDNQLFSASGLSRISFGILNMGIEKNRQMQL